MTFIMKKKKYKFNVTITVEQLSSVPLMNAVFFVKCRLLDGGSFVDYTDRREVEDNCVKWNKTFNFLTKMYANASTGLLDTCTLKLSIRKETKGGKAYLKLGYVDLNLASFPGHGRTECRCLLEGYENRLHRQDNSMLHISVDMAILAGDPCFKTPPFTCVTQHTQQESCDILSTLSNKQDDFLDEQQSETNIIGLPTNTDNSAPSSRQHSNLPTPTFETQTILNAIAGGNSSNNGGIPPNTSSECNGPIDGGGGATTTATINRHSQQHYHEMTSSATSNTTNGSTITNFDPFEPNHSRSNSSQTSSSRISVTGYNSLPTHSRQGSADSEHNNARYSNEIKFNSVDRVKRSNLYERTKPTVLMNGSGGLLGESSADRVPASSTKNVLDSTRISADQFVAKLLQSNNFDDITAQPMETFPSENGGELGIVITPDGSATITSRRAGSGHKSSKSSSNGKTKKDSTKQSGKT